MFHRRMKCKQVWNNMRQYFHFSIPVIYAVQRFVWYVFAMWLRIRFVMYIVSLDDRSKVTYCLLAKCICNGAGVQRHFWRLLHALFHLLHPGHHLVQAVLHTQGARQSHLQLLVAVTHRLRQVVVSLCDVIYKQKLI